MGGQGSGSKISESLTSLGYLFKINSIIMTIESLLARLIIVIIVYLILTSHVIFSMTMSLKIFGASVGKSRADRGLPSGQGSTLPSPSFVAVAFRGPLAVSTFHVLE